MAKKILLVDDRNAVAAVDKKRLTTKNFAAEIATTQAQARDMLERKDYDLCLIDIRVPGMSGMELYYQLKRERPELAVKVILTDGDAAASAMSQQFGKIRRPFLVRPFTARQLRSVLQTASLQIDTPSHNDLGTGKEPGYHDQSLVGA